MDWIIVQMHQCAASSSVTGNGSDLGIRQEWLPLFDRYQVDLVLNGHDHGYERSFPVRGADTDAGHEVATGAIVNTLRPHPVTTTDSGVVRHQPGHGAPHPRLRRHRRPHEIRDSDTSRRQSTPHPGGASPTPRWTSTGPTPPTASPAKVFTRANRPALTSTPGVYARAGADAVEDAIWSARRDTSTGYGIAVFDVEPAGSEAGGQASIKVTHYHAVGADPVNPGTGAKGRPTPDYTEFETFRLVRPRLSAAGQLAHWDLRRGPRRASIARDTVGLWMFS